ncbi:MAG: rRNA maturation RNase YbeY [Defluviitaleaceae bacterium]|nr:rRNA maturation RNase YbeY [Defluviitaleaceae bacterium]
MKIHWDDRGETPVPKPLYVTLKKAALAALKECFELDDIKKLQYEVSISFVTDEEIKELNNTYRGLDKPTDVLSFPSMESPDTKKGKAPFSIGDIVISTQTAARQAQEYAHSEERELAFLTVHGVLHLLGLDHEASANDEKIMNELQEKILNELGILR